MIIETPAETNQVDPVEHLIRGAERHAEVDDPDHEVGDLQDLLRAAWSVMPPPVRHRFLQTQAVKEAIVALDGYGEMATEVPYIHGNWGHLFGVGSRETMTRFVLDVAEQKIVAMQIQDGPLADRWINATREMILDFQDSVLNANGECLGAPEEFHLERAYILPEWAAPITADPEQAVQAQMPRERG